MRRYARKPAVAILLLAGGVGGWYVSAPRQGAGQGADLAAMETAIARGNPTAATWLAYAEALRGRGRFAHAAVAYRKVLEEQPGDRQARLGCAAALAEGQAGDELYAYLRDLVYNDPKLALDICGQQECQRYLAEGRFLALQKEARVQVMD